MIVLQWLLLQSCSQLPSSPYSIGGILLGRILLSSIQFLHHRFGDILGLLYHSLVFGFLLLPKTFQPFPEERFGQAYDGIHCIRRHILWRCLQHQSHSSRDHYDMELLPRLNSLFIHGSCCRSFSLVPSFWSNVIDYHWTLQFWTKTFILCGSILSTISPCCSTCARKKHSWGIFARASKINTQSTFQSKLSEFWTWTRKYSFGVQWWCTFLFKYREGGWKVKFLGKEGEIWLWRRPFATYVQWSFKLKMNPWFFMYYTFIQDVLLVFDTILALKQDMVLKDDLSCKDVKNTCCFLIMYMVVIRAKIAKFYL